MLNQDFKNRIVIVIRKDIEGWQAANTLAHISAYIGNHLENNFGTGEFFVTSDNAKFPRNSQYPIIIKSAPASLDLKVLLEKVRAGNFVHLGFIREMIDHTDDVELQTALSVKTDSEVELLGVGLFGSTEDLKTLTKEFSLWK
ncbi:MAG: DUF2000 domain-containing protein [Parcubacteria group bacterium]